MRRLIGAMVTLVCVGLLSSCSIFPSPVLPVYDDSNQQCAYQMARIADAVKDHDTVALRKLFSPRAREKAKDLDGGLDYFLSTFGSSRVTWKLTGMSSASKTNGSKTTVELNCDYDVRADGKRYELYFAYFPTNEVVDPRNVGIYALGVSPYTKNKFTASGDPKPFYKWKASFQLIDHVTSGEPGVYVPQRGG